MPFAQVKFWKTHRFQLTVWNTVTSLLLVVLTLVGLREGLRLSLWNEADHQLVEDAAEVKLTIEQLYPDLQQIHDELNRKAVSHTHRGLYIRIFAENGDGLWNSANFPNVYYPPSLAKSGMTPISFGERRLVHFHLKSPPHWIVRVGTSFEPLEASVAQLTRLMVAVGLIVVVVSPLGGYWLAGRVIRPMAAIIKTTAKLQPMRLNQRLTLRGTDDELDRLSSTINGFLDRIAAYIRQNQEFTSNAAHELRSPLTAIQSSLEVALNTDRTIEEYQDLLAELLDECERLRVLVNHLLLLAETDAQRLDVLNETVSLHDLLARSCDMFTALAESTGVHLRLRTTEPTFVRGHSGSLRQVVNNLIDNALKFTEDGGEVIVSLSRDGDAAIITVHDTGSGIAPEDLAFVFERFYRGERARTRQGRGSGLGLSICQSIVKAHGGEISIASPPGQGTTVTVRLPACAVPPDVPVVGLEALPSARS